VWQEESPWRKDQFFPHQKVLLLARISKVNFLSREDQRNNFRIVRYFGIQGIHLEDSQEATGVRSTDELEDQREGERLVFTVYPLDTCLLPI
jgi:hypothetical protein